MDEHRTVEWMTALLRRAGAVPPLTEAEKEELWQGRMELEKAHWSDHHVPLCKCGSRNSKGVGQSALMRQCQDCGFTYAYRLRDGVLVPFAPTTAAAMDEAR